MATITDKMLQRFFEVLQASKLPSELLELLAAPTSSHFCVIQQGENDALKISVPRLRGKYGTYDASSNTPALYDGGGIGGDSYIVSVAGTHDFGRGPTALAKDDILEYRDGRWLKVGFALTQAAMVAALGYTPENVSNKAIDFSVVNDTLYPTTKAVQDLINSLGVTDKNYVHDQPTAATVWAIPHGLGKKPAITILDTAGNEIEGAERHIDLNNSEIEFNSPTAGTAECN